MNRFYGLSRSAQNKKKNRRLTGTEPVSFSANRFSFFWDAGLPAQVKTKRAKNAEKRH